MYQRPPFNCFVLVHFINGHILFSCLSLPYISFSTAFHFFTFSLLIFSILFLSIFLLFIFKLLFLLKRELSEKHVLLEVTPPSNTKQTTFTTEQFMTSLHSLGNQWSLIDLLLGRKNLFSLELVSSKDAGIRYVLRIPFKNEFVLKRQILSFLPGAKITNIPEYLPNRDKDSGFWEIKELKLSKHFVFPLQEQKLLSQYDPIAYFTGHMTQLNRNDVVLLQLIISPVTKHTHHKEYSLIKYLIAHITRGENAISLIRNNNSFVAIVLRNIFLLIPFILLSPFSLIGFFFFGGKNGDFLPFWLFRNESKKSLTLINPQQQDIQHVVHQKITKELFETSIRLFIHADKTAVSQRMQGLLSSFQTLHTSNQTLDTNTSLFFNKQYEFFKLRNRLLSLKNNPILSVSELANIFHFPYSPITHTEDLIQSKYQDLPAPLSLKNYKNSFDVIFAQNKYGGTIVPIGLTQDQRQKHMLIIGATKMGKTTLLNTMIVEDIKAGKGICVIDPHGDLIENILLTIPEERQKDVILFDPDDTAFPIGFNILAIPDNLSKDELEKYKDQLTSNIISVFQKLFPIRGSAHRMEHILRMSVLTVLETKNPTLFTVQQLLTDYKFRKQIVETLKDPVLIQFWKKEFNSMGSFQRTEMISPITNKLGSFLTSHMTRNILGQKRSTFDFTDIMNNKKILLCNLSKGKLGGDKSAFFGALVTAKIQIAALQRARISEEKRTDFYLYIDEFQNFATPSFTEIMSEARKFRLFAILAHQTTAQIDDKNFIEIILANVGTVIAFRTGSPADEKYLLPFFTPEVQEGQISSLAPFHFYIKITDNVPPIAFTGVTVKNDIVLNRSAKEIILNLTREKFGRPKEIVEKEIAEYFTNIMPAESKNENNQTRKNAEEYFLINIV